MNGGLTYILSSVIFGVGLAADAFLISLSNGITKPLTKSRVVCADAAVFAVFQFVAPLFGWFFVKTAAERFGIFKNIISFTALAVLLFLGVKMLAEGLRKPEMRLLCPSICARFAPPLVVQAAATSVDALSAGLTIAEYGLYSAVAGSAIIAAITFAVYVAGHFIGRKFGAGFNGCAHILGGIIFIIMALETVLGVI